MDFPHNLKLDPADIEARGVLRDRETNLIRSRVGILLSLYFKDGYLREKRRELIGALGEYLGFFGDQITHFKHGEDGRLYKYSGEGMPDAYLRDADLPESQMFYLHVRHYDPREQNDPSLYTFMAFGHQRGDQWPLSGLKVYIPPSFVFEQTERFLKLIEGWCDRLDVVHGSGGLGTLSNPGSETSGDAYYYPWLAEYPALEYDAMGNYFAATYKGGFDRPRSSNWLTILGGDNVAQLGGEAAIAAQLSGDMSVIRLKSGIMIRAGALPALGNTAAGGVPAAYRNVARIVKPIRFEEYRFSIFKLPAHLNSGKEARLAENLKWIRRFD
ncbi:type VI immunity family protein [Rhizobium aegyptiacum]|uniref:type VI immunity family protein n=1 Tax=Rhizobium aegyptiacum TaxID=1764550 RepID=UPI0007E56E58|nr:type VI immunity family protein [Rhizobium aegyptiacum]